MTDFEIALATGLVTGGLSAVGASSFLVWWWRPRLSRWLRIATDFVPDRQVTGNAEPIGRLFKIQFALKGRSSPEWGAVEVTWRSHKEGVPDTEVRRVFAKWDELPMPINRHRREEFHPERVPATYYQPLVLERVYDVPILFRDRATGRLDIFSGWWFGREQGYKDFMFGLDPSTPLLVELVGSNGLRAGIGPITLQELMDSAVKAADARESIHQHWKRDFLMKNGRRYTWRQRRRARRASL